ncbi:MAG: hypothetical protein SOZ01_11245 [Selenomonadaceae bacterium]|nr:hypothetical protein [Selenomonadaceae bacterium]
MEVKAWLQQHQLYFIDVRGCEAELLVPVRALLAQYRQLSGAVVLIYREQMDAAPIYRVCHGDAAATQLPVAELASLRQLYQVYDYSPHVHLLSCASQYGNLFNYYFTGLLTLAEVMEIFLGRAIDGAPLLR